MLESGFEKLPRDIQIRCLALWGVPIEEICDMEWERMWQSDRFKWGLQKQQVKRIVCGCDLRGDDPYDMLEIFF